MRTGKGGNEFGVARAERQCIFSFPFYSDKRTRNCFGRYFPKLPLCIVFSFSLAILVRGEGGCWEVLESLCDISIAVRLYTINEFNQKKKSHFLTLLRETSDIL
jgi:hypothetical protein